MLARVPRVIAMRQEERLDEIRRSLVTLPAPPVAQIGGAELIMLTWWRRRGPYAVGRRFATRVPHA